MEEQILIKKCQADDAVAFEELLGNYETMIYNLTYRFFGNHHDASDVGQEALLRVYRKIKDFNGKSSFKTWLYRVVSNLCLDEIRKRKKRKDSSLEEAKESGYEPLAGDVTPMENVLQKERFQLIQEILLLLTEEHRTILILKDIEGLDYNEISQVLNCNIGTVKSRLSRARESFRQKLATRPKYSVLIEGRVQHGM